MNQPSLDDILADPRQLATLPVGVLADLFEATKALRDKAAVCQKALMTAVEDRYGAQIGAAYQREAKDTGTVHVQDGEFDLAFDRPKKVEWDQAKLQAIGDKIEAAGEDPSEYIDISLTIPEKRYTALPPSIARTFEPARTVKPGTITVKISEREKV